MSESTVVMPSSPAWSTYRATIEGLKAGRSHALKGIEILREISDATDTLIHSWFRESCRDQNIDPDNASDFALLALGGYGRREMAPSSDVDLMLLHEGELKEPLAQAFTKFTHRFYDARLHLGASVRSIQGALEFSDEDIEALTAMLESRRLLGSLPLVEDFIDKLGRKVRKRSRRYLEHKIVERDERLASYGNSINIQEPNLKESPGGLRDYHQGLWLTSIKEGRKMTVAYLVRMGYITQRDERRLRHALDFIFRMRCQLHWLGKGKGDLIRMDIQQALAEALGYKDNEDRLAEERMMHEYYAAASVIRQFADDVTERCRVRPRWHRWLRRARIKRLDDGLIIRDDELDLPDDLHYFENEPSRFLKVFAHLAATGARLSNHAEAALSDNRGLVDAHYMTQSEPKRIFRDLLAFRGCVAPSLRVMDKLDVLSRVLPEWKHIKSLVRHDLLHRYTVDEHTLLALELLESFAEEDLEYSGQRQKIFENMKKPDVMRLLVLSHDIGKGYKRDHSVVGAELVAKIASRLDYPKDDIDTLSFLVRNHLDLSHISQRRDVSDPRVLAEFADFIGTVERLEMLYLLTHVDIAAVRPDMMTSWKNHLLWQLYSGVRRVLEDASGESRRPELVMARHIEKTEKSLSDRFGAAAVKEHLSLLPRDYLFRHSAEAISDHLALIRELNGNHSAIRFRDRDDPRFQEVVVATHDRVGLFRRLCLAFLLENYGIVNAQLNTRSDGLVCNELVISDQVESVRDKEGGRMVLRERLENLLAAEGDLPRLPMPIDRRRPKRTRYSSQVTIYNELSEDYTVVDVRSVDRTGILLTITEVFLELELSIQYANLITEGNRVVDVFYLMHRQGGKIIEPENLERLKSRLLESLEDTGNE